LIITGNRKSPTANRKICDFRFAVCDFIRGFERKRVLPAISKIKKSKSENRNLKPNFLRTKVVT
jgi:hypothetical protein